MVAFAQLMFQWESGHDYHPLLLLVSLPVGVFEELDKLFFWKPYKIFAPSSLFASKNVEQTERNTVKFIRQ